MINNTQKKQNSYWISWSLFVQNCGHVASAIFAPMMMNDIGEDNNNDDEIWRQGKQLDG